MKEKFRPDSPPESENAIHPAIPGYSCTALPVFQAILDTVSFMRISLVPIVPLVLIAASSLVAGDARAQRGLPEASPLQGRAANVRGNERHDRSAEQRALSAAVRRVESQTGGQVLSAERIPFDGRDVSRIKVVDASGRVRVYMDDPQSSRAGRGGRIQRAPTRDDDN